MRETFYASLGLMGKESPVGKIFSAEDLKKIFDEGHEVDAIPIITSMPGKEEHRSLSSQSKETKKSFGDSLVIQNLGQFHVPRVNRTLESNSLPAIISSVAVGEVRLSMRGGHDRFHEIMFYR